MNKMSPDDDTGPKTTDKKLILDTTAFLESDEIVPRVGEATLTMMTVPEVIEEVRSRQAVLSEMAAHRLKVVSPGDKFLSEVQGAVDSTGDALSDADERVVALAVQENGTVVSDDYGVQNVCRHMGIPFMPMTREGIKEEWRYTYRCRGCGRVFDRETKACPVCGHEVRKVRYGRKPKE